MIESECELSSVCRFESWVCLRFFSKALDLVSVDTSVLKFISYNKRCSFQEIL